MAIVSLEQLAREYSSGDPSLTIVDARREGEFAAGHLPGAVWIGWEVWCEPAPIHAGPTLAQPGYWGVIDRAARESLAGRLEAKGLSTHSKVVVYGDGPRTRGREGRVAWTLLYFGASNVRLLDGGWSGWAAAGGEVEEKIESPVRGEFTVALREERRRSLPELHEAYQRGELPAFVDTRSRAEFDGEIQEYLPRRGHLPGASLVPFKELFDESGRYVSAKRFTDLLPETVRSAPEIVSYCEVGVRASLFALLHEAHTGQIVPVYDGSIMQWGLDPELPLDRS